MLLYLRGTKTVVKCKYIVLLEWEGKKTDVRKCRYVVLREWKGKKMYVGNVNM